MPNNEPTAITLSDQNGNDVQFEYLDVIQYDNEEYILLLPINDTSFSEDGEVVILKIENLDDENETYVGIEDQDLLNEVFTIFLKKHNLES